RRLLWHVLREPVERVMREVVRRNGLPDDPSLYATHALHAVETGLRSRPPAQLARQTWEAFRAAQLVQVARSAMVPHGAPGGAPEPPELPESPAYRSGTFFRPHAKVGEQFFGGDWYAGRCPDDGSLWVFLADVTGHGYFAYLLASALPAVWQRCWNDHPGKPPEPAELLADMHELLSDSMPDGIYLEATLVRLLPDGDATVVPAGGTRLLVRGRDGPRTVKLRGAWLGLRAPTRSDQHELHLAEGDELVLATDGVFDQLGEGDVDKAWRKGRTVFDVVRGLLEESLARSEQKDDITLVMLERQGEGPAILKFPARRGDV
ncbi:MAG: serine/threonine-protein phosphatase, partial [Gemmataceae bacterium]|nr:serine/threonine-protein phosphatase [Gemmataceae bacterium]